MTPRAQSPEKPQAAVRWERLAGPLLVLLTVLAYQPVLTADFNNFDDPLYVTSSAHMRAGLTWANFVWAWQANVASNWHPLTLLSHMLDVEIWGLNGPGHHVTSLLLHAANVWLLFAVLAAMTGARWRSALVAALFAVHPTHVESVAWIAERKDVLSGFFFLLTLAAYLRYTRRPSVRRYLAVALACALGLLAKPMLVTLPCVLLLLDVWPLGRLPTTSWRAAWKAAGPLLREKLPLFGLAAAASAVAVYTQQGSMAALTVIPMGRRVGNALVSYTAYLGKTLWPAKLAAFYPLPAAVPLGEAAAAGLLIAAVTALALGTLRRAPWFAVGWLWFLGMLVPVIGILQVGRQSMADRYTYLPSIGLFVVVVWGLAAVSAWREASRVMPALRATLAVGIVIALAVACRAQAATWHDSMTLFRHAIAVTRANYIAHFNLGVALADEGQGEEGFAEYLKAVEANANMQEAQAAVGDTLLERDLPDQALPHLERSVLLERASAERQLALADALEDLGRGKEAMAARRKALQLEPTSAVVHREMGEALAARGKTAQALAELQQAIALDPTLTDAYAPAARLLAARGGRGDLARAAGLFAEVVRRQPRSATAAYDLAVVLERMGKTGEARRYYTRALWLDPQRTAARDRLALTGGVPPGLGRR